MYYVYILKSEKDNKLYVGYSKDLKNRINEHNNKRVKSTINCGVLKLIYYEGFLSQKDAIKKEKYYKTCSGRKHIKSHLGNSINIDPG